MFKGTTNNADNSTRLIWQPHSMSTASPPSNFHPKFCEYPQDIGHGIPLFDVSVKAGTPVFQFL